MDDKQAGAADGGSPASAGRSASPPEPEGPEGWRDELRDILEQHSTEFVLAVSARGELRGSTQTVSLGWTPEEQGGHHIAETLHPDDLPRVFDLLERARQDTSFKEQIHVQARHKDGSWRVLSATVMAVEHHRLDFDGAVVRVRDLTDDLPTSDGLGVGPPQRSPDSSASDAGDGRFLSLAEAVPMGILSADARGWVVFVNDAANDLFDLPTERLLGSGWLRAVAEEDREDVTAATRAVVAQSARQEVTCRIATGLFPRWVHARFVPLGGTPCTGWIATVDDITERRRAESKLAHMATHDSLTGLPNRVLLEDRLRQACGRLRRGSDSLTVVFVDLDGFKAVNDNLGHAVGDAVLVQTAHRLRTGVRDVDTTARLGGDEFVIVCESLAPEEAAEVAGRVERAIQEPFRAEGEVVHIGASAGVVSTSDPDVDISDLLGRADQAMYRMKHAHRQASEAAADSSEHRRDVDSATTVDEAEETP